MEDLEIVVERAQAGDALAYTALIERFQRMAYGYAYAYLNDFARAQDAAQEAFIQAYLALPDLREPRAFATWFKRILFKHCDRLARGRQAASLEMESELAARQWHWIGQFHWRMVAPFRLQGLPDAQIGLAQATWEILRDEPAAEAAALRETWNMERFNFFTYADRQDWEALERLAWRGVREWKLDENATGVIVACAALGKPTPPELLQAAERGGVESVDSYGLFGWYMLAREAAAVGDEDRAFAAPRRSLGYWSNPPALMLSIWENDARWGALRERAEFRQIFAEKRARIGPMGGSLHYFPEW